MKRIPYTNRLAHSVVIGLATIAPGDTRMVDPSLVPDQAPAPPTVDDTPSDPVLAILDDSVPTIAAQLPFLSDDDLARVEQGEADGKTRKGVMAAIEEEKLRRAKVAEAADALRGFSDEELAEQADSEEDETVLAAIAKIRAERAAEGEGETEGTSDGE